MFVQDPSAMQTNLWNRRNRSKPRAENSMSELRTHGENEGDLVTTSDRLRP